MPFQLEITKLVPPGDGFGYYNDKAVFVPGTVVGDLVEVSIVKEKKRHSSARLERVIVPGKDRIEAPCPHYETCGGCSLQHLSYAKQIEVKQQLLQEIFANQQIEITPSVIPSPREFHFRTRTRIQLKDGVIGFSAKNSHRLVAIEGCLILSSGIMSKLPALLRLGRNHCEFSLLESSRNGEVAISVSEGKKLVPLPGHPTGISEDYGFGPIRLTSDGFAQSNPFVTALICQQLVEQVSVTTRVCELFCGSGTFSIPLAKKIEQLSGFDISKASIETASQNAKQNGLENTSFTAANLEKTGQLPPCDMIVADPPRKGLGTTTLNQIGRANASTLLYVSCNPASLVRDIKALMLSHGFNLSSVTAYDMYPHATHLETLAILQR